jgi:hypothetical protein
MKHRVIFLGAVLAAAVTLYDADPSAALSVAPTGLWSTAQGSNREFARSDEIRVAMMGRAASRGANVNRNVNRDVHVNNNVSRNVTVNHNANRNVNQNGDVNVNVGHGVVRPWVRHRHFGTIVAGVALGTIIIVTDVGVMPAAPDPNICWFWNDASQTNGYWDYCTPPPD